MKQFSKFVAASVLLAVSSLANATLISDTYNPTPFVVKQNRSLTFLHDFTDSGYVGGFDRITSASLTIWLKDSGKDQGGSETYTLKINHDGSTLLSGSNIDNGVSASKALGIVGPSLAALNETGQLWFTLAASKGDFEFVRSTLDAEFTAGVPEPVSVALMGLGLTAIGATRRRKA